MQPTTRLRILNLGVVSSQDSQAIYHAVASCMTEDSPDTIIICRPKDPYFCIGYHQNVRQVLDESTRSELGYPVVRRRLGGGVTYLDDQQLFYQSIFHRKRSPAIPANVYKERLRQPINMLNRIGVEAVLRYTNEVEVSGRRIAGIGGGMIGEASVVVGNVLNDFNYQVMSQIINSPCAEFRDLALSAMSERITTLKREDQAQHWQDLPELLIEEYRRDFGDAVYIGELRMEESIEVSRLAERMASEEYLAEFQNDLPIRPLIRLKVSASTSIELIRVRESSSIQNQFVVLKLRENLIEEVCEANSFEQRLVCPDPDSIIRVFNESKIYVGVKFGND